MYQWRKGIATWQVGKTLYISVPFTWLVADAEKMACQYKAKGLKVLTGGPGFMQPSHCDGFEPILFHNPCATASTHGCPNNCPFCAVKLLHPDYVEYPNYRPAPVLCDDNWTAASWVHQQRVIERQKVFSLTDFNQGIEARRFKPALADLMGTIRCKVRFAFDSWGQEAAVKDAIDLCRKRTTKNIFVYCLIGFNDDPESAKARLDLVRSWGVKPMPMRYQPLDAKEKNAYIAPGWTHQTLQRMMRFYSHTAVVGNMPFDEFEQPAKEQLALGV